MINTVNVPLRYKLALEVLEYTNLDVHLKINQNRDKHPISETQWSNISYNKRTRSYTT